MNEAEYTHLFSILRKTERTDNALTTPYTEATIASGIRGQIWGSPRYVDNGGGGRIIGAWSLICSLNVDLQHDDIISWNGKRLRVSMVQPLIDHQEASLEDIT